MRKRGSMKLMLPGTSSSPICPRGEELLSGKGQWSGRNTASKAKLTLVVEQNSWVEESPKALMRGLLIHTVALGELTVDS